MNNLQERFIECNFSKEELEQIDKICARLNVIIKYEENLPAKLNKLRSGVFLLEIAFPQGSIMKELLDILWGVYEEAQKTTRRKFPFIAREISQ